MSNGPSALFVRHKALPGKREEARRIWEKHVRPRVEKNPDHLAYYFCFEDGDPDEGSGCGDARRWAVHP